MRRLEAEQIGCAALEIRRLRTRWLEETSAGAAPAREVSHTSFPGGFGCSIKRHNDRFTHHEGRKTPQVERREASAFRKTRAAQS
jgi:hypothetical protein